MGQVSLDSGEMRNFLQHIVENNRHIQSSGKKPVATEISGESGLGKTSIVLQVAEENGLELVKINLSQIEELGDLVGFPIRQFELCQSGAPVEGKAVMKKVVVDGKVVMKKVAAPAATKGKCIWVDENATEQYTKQGYSFTGEKRMSYCPPEWISNIQGGGILLLDDYTRADQRFLQACMELCDRQEYISWKLPNDWHIILTTNPDDGEYSVNAIDVAQKTRFVSVDMKWSHERWAEWAEKQGIDGRCINFVLMHPEIVTAEVNPRSITTFFNCISSFKKFEDELPMIQMIGEGSVGGEVATLFNVFINNRLDKLISPKDIIHLKDEVDVRTKLLDAICNGGSANDYRADIASIMTTRLINYALHYAEDNKIGQDIIDRLIFLVKDEDIFTDDLKYHIVKKVINGNKQKFQKFLFDDSVQDYATK